MEAFDPLALAQHRAKLHAAALALLNDRLAEFGFPAEGSRRLTALQALAPALLKHLDGDPSPVPDRHAFVDASGAVRIAPALNSERIDTPGGAVLYINLRTLAELIRHKNA